MSHLKSHKNHWRWLPFFFHTPQKCADQNWGVFSKTHFKPDSHMPSSFSSSILPCCFNTKHLLIDSPIVYLKHPLFSVSLPRRALHLRKLFLKWQNSPILPPNLSYKKSNHFLIPQASPPWYLPHHNPWFSVLRLDIHQDGGEEQFVRSILNRWMYKTTVDDYVIFLFSGRGKGIRFHSQRKTVRIAVKPWRKRKTL